MKQFIALIFIIMFQTTCMTNQAAAAELSKDEIIIILLQPQIISAVNTFYSEYIKDNPSTATFYTEIINTSHTGGERKITVEVMPYLGPHIVIGRDIVEIVIDIDGSAKVVDFKHKESYDISPYPVHKSLIKPLPAPVRISP